MLISGPLRHHFPYTSRSVQKNVTITHSVLEATRDAEAVVIATEWKEFKTIDWKAVYAQMSKPAFLFDGRLLVNADELRQIGFRVCLTPTPKRLQQALTSLPVRRYLPSVAEKSFESPRVHVLHRLPFRVPANIYLDPSFNCRTPLYIRRSRWTHQLCVCPSLLNCHCEVVNPAAREQSQSGKLV